MRLYPRELEIGDFEGFTPEKDIFGREQFGISLGNLFANVEDPLVAVLDAPWGSGKTVFVKMWCGHMRNRGFPVIYFDAFKNDFSSDAFLALAGEVLALADEIEPAKGDARNNFLVKAQKVALAAFTGGVKKCLSKLIGDSGVEEVVSAASEEAANSVVDSLNGYVMKKLEGRQEEKDSIREFGRALGILATELSRLTNPNALEITNTEQTANPGGGVRPLIFVIDELDRCKPPFALDVIEKIKHYFSVEQVHFLLVTHLEQLKHSVRYAYGLGTQAGAYLHKFYHIALSIPATKDIYGQSIAKQYIDRLLKDMPDDKEEGQHINDLKKVIMAYIHNNNSPLRTIEKIVTRVAVFIASTNPTQIRHPAIIGVLITMKVTNNKLFEQAKTMTLHLNEVLHHMNPKNDDTFDVWCIHSWGYCIGSTEYHEKNEAAMNNASMDYSNYRFKSRTEIVPWACSLIDNIAITE